MTNQLEVVAYHQYARKKPDERSLSFLKALPSILRNTGWESEPLARQSDALAVIEQQQADMRQMACDIAAIQEMHSQQKATLYHRVAEIEAENARLRNAEPFGYFRAMPFGWEDCAETDEGAIALYERADHIRDVTKMIDWPADDKRIDALGQNGGDGLHHANTELITKKG